MYKKLEEMPDSARIWLFQANRALLDHEVSFIEKELAGFIAVWQAHGQPLKGSCRVFENRFLLIAQNSMEHTATGCSIDSITNQVLAIGNELGIDFMDRSQVAYQNKLGEVETIPFQNVKPQLIAGKLQAETVVYDNTVQSLAAWKEEWKKPLKHSWMKRHLPKQEA